MNYKIKAAQIDNATSLRLIKQYQANGDIESRNQVLLGNIKLIYPIARTYCRKFENNFEDLVSEGILGMIEAINRFNTDLYSHFSTYAQWYILNRISGASNMGTLHLPQHRIQIYQNYEKEKTKMLDGGETPSFDVIAKRIGVSTAILTDTINKREEISIDYTVTDDATGPKFTEMQRSFASPQNLEEEIEIKMDFEKTKNLIHTILSKQEQEILKYRFGLDGEDPLTLQETSQHMNISTEYVRVLQNKSLLKLNRLLSRKW